MIHQLLIILNSGVCVFHYEFTPLKIDPQLFSGFTSALNSFASNMMEQAQLLEFVKMTEFHLIISPFKSFFLVLIVNKYDDLNAFDQIIVDLENIFLEKFGHYSERDNLQMSNFDVFEPIAEKICKNTLNIAILNHQTPAKIEFWNLLKTNCNLTNGNQTRDLSHLQLLSSDIRNCAVAISNIDIEQNLENLIQQLENKQIIFIVIEPNFNTLLKIIPKLDAIQHQFKNSVIYGILLKKYGPILKENCETILNLKTFELISSEDSQSKEVYQILMRTIMGIY